MILFPAIDLYGGKAVRLYKGDYTEMTVYSDDPLSVARDFYASGAKYIHMVDLEGARDGNTPNLDTVKKIAEKTGLFTEIGGGIRDILTVRRYLENGVDRVILGTSAVEDEAFLTEALSLYGDRIAVGADIRDGELYVKGWLSGTGVNVYDFFRKMQSLGVKTVISTDISRDGAMRGTNRELYASLSREFSVNIVASGGVSTLDDIAALRKMGLYGAIVGKAYYTGAVSLPEALSVARGEKDL